MRKRLAYATIAALTAVAAMAPAASAAESSQCDPKQLFGCANAVVCAVAEKAGFQCVD